MKKVNRGHLPSSSAPAPKFGQGDAARHEFQNMLNQLAYQLGPAIEPVQSREMFLAKLRTLMGISTGKNADYERWTRMLEREAQNLEIRRLWACLEVIEQENR